MVWFLWAQPCLAKVWARETTTPRLALAQLLKSAHWAGEGAQWRSACLACVRPQAAPGTPHTAGPTAMASGPNPTASSPSHLAGVAF